MPVGFCLLKKHVDSFKAGLMSGEINPANLAQLSSAERRAFLAKYVGEGAAKEVNSSFESKLLLKNQQRGIIQWAKEISGIKPEIRRDLIGRIQRMDRVLDPKEQQQFLADLASTKLGVDVSEREAKNISDLAQKVTEAETAKKADGTFASESDRLKYGYAVTDLKDYVSELKGSAMSLKLQDFKGNPLKAGAKLGDAIAGNAKAITASLDNSSIFRQGWKTMWTNPGIWGKNAVKTFDTLVREFGGNNVMREVDADIVSRPNYGLYQKAKLAVGNLEEAFPTTLPEKIPLFGRVYKASESAYTGFVQKTRADVFDKYIDIAKKSGVDLTDQNELRAIGDLVNSLTGRGNLGKLEPAANAFNNVFFSPRFVKSNIDIFTQPLTGARGSNFVRKQAAINLIKVASGTAAILAIANNLQPGAVDFDPRSSDFGKIRVGDTRFDVTGGIGSLVTLAARIATLSTKSASTGKITKLNEGGFGDPTALDTAFDFIQNKASPAAGIIRDLLKGQDMNGNKPTWQTILYGSFTPLGVQNFIQTANNPSGAPVLITMLADGLGIAASTYSPKGGGGQASWADTKSKELMQFKSKVGASDFDTANHKFDAAYNSWLSGIRNNPKYKALSDDEKGTLIQKEKDKLQNDIFKQYNFKYERVQTDEHKKNMYKSLLSN